MSNVSIDVLAPQKSHIDLSDKALPSDFGLDDYKLSKLMDDIMLIEYVDLIGDGSGEIMRNGVIVPVNMVMNAWRKGVVIIKGPNVRYTEVGEIVMFPSNMGIPITNVEVTGYGKVKNGLFLNEQRMFGVCEVNETNKTN
jgi:hypothetical protein